MMKNACFIGMIHRRRKHIIKETLYHYYRDESTKGYSLRKPEDYWTTHRTADNADVRYVKLFFTLEGLTKVWNEQQEIIKSHKLRVYEIIEQEEFSDGMYTRTVKYIEHKDPSTL